jgi:signal transduction histidine kinase
VLILGLVGAWAADAWYARTRLTAERLRVDQDLAPYSNAITNSVNRRMALLSGLRAFVAIGRDAPAFDANFAAYAAALAGSATGIRAVQYAENGVERNTWPRAGNEQAIQYDFRRHPVERVRADLERAERSSRVVLSGPLDLIQGGLGLVGRLSVDDLGSTRIGVVNVVLDLPPLFAEARLDAAPSLRLALRDEGGHVFFGSAAVFGADPVIHPVLLTDRRWTPAAIPAAGWAAPNEGTRGFRLAAAGIVALLALTAWLAASRHASLAAAVAERTESLTAANRSLEEQVAQREQVEAQLMHSQKMEGLGRLAGGIAHDFNNILTGILGYVSLLQDEIQPGTEARADLDEIERASRRASDLTRQLLTFARKQTISPSLVDLNELIRNVDRILHRLIGEDVEMVVDLADELPAVRVDPAQLEQVLTNLVVNARDAMPRGGKITIATRLVQATPTELGIGLGVGARITDFVQLEVRDTGVGMDARTMARVFEPFFTTKEPGRGTGLGLAISYGIVQEAGGAISVSSEPGVGTAVTIHLPPAAGSATPIPERRERPRDSTSAETVLIVEDEPLVRGLAERALKGRGYTVLTAGDGDVALEVARSWGRHIDLLVTDVIMPRTGGRLVAEQLSAARPGLKVLFISGHVDDPRVREAIESRGAAFLPKPFTPNDLADAVRRVLD